MTIRMLSTNAHTLSTNALMLGTTVPRRFRFHTRLKSIHESIVATVMTNTTKFYSKTLSYWLPDHCRSFPWPSRLPRCQYDVATTSWADHADVHDFSDRRYRDRQIGTVWPGLYAQYIMNICGNTLQCMAEQHWNFQEMCNVMTSWCHQIETISALLALCAGNLPVISEFPSQRPVTWSFDFFICPWTNAWVNNQDIGDLRCHHSHYDISVMNSTSPWNFVLSLFNVSFR